MGSTSFPNSSAKQTLSVQMPSLKGRVHTQTTTTRNYLISLHSGWTETKQFSICIEGDWRHCSVVKMAQPPTVSEDLCFLPRNLVGWLTPSCNSSSGGSNVLFWPLRALFSLNTHVGHTHMDTPHKINHKTYALNSMKMF